jgi:hypothetical protein
MGKIEEKMAYTMGALKSHEDLALCNRRPQRTILGDFQLMHPLIVGRK